MFYSGTHVQSSSIIMMVAHIGLTAIAREVKVGRQIWIDSMLSPIRSVSRRVATGSSSVVLVNT